MRVKHALVATVSALLLTAGGFAQAQQSQTAPGAPDTGKSGMQSESTTPGAASPMDKSTASLPPGSLHEIKEDKAMVKDLNLTVNDLSGMDIYGSDGKKIGDVNKVLADSSNDVKAVTVDVGGFLGIGAKEVVLPIDKLQKGTEKDRLQTTMTKADIEKLDKWESSTGTGASSPGAGPSRTAPGTSAPSR